MRRRAAFWLAWAIGGLSVAMYVVGVVLYVLVRAAQAPGEGDGSGSFGSGPLVFLPFLAFPIVGALIAANRPKNSIGWICLAAGFLWMLIVLGDSSTGSMPSSVAIDALTQWAWVPPLGLLGIYLPLLFPDGRLPSRRWRFLAWFSAAVMASFSVLTILAPGPLESHPGVRNPFGIEEAPWLGGVAIGTVLMFALCILASALSLVFRYQRSSGEQREQIKWITFAASFVGLVYLGGLIGELIFAPNSLSNEGTPPLWVSVEQSLLLMSYAGIPVAVGFAILKHRLYDIDILINRTLVYGSLTVTLAAVYLGSVVALQYVFRVLTGSESQLAVVASTLVIAALFNPLRHRVQELVDRRFYRKKYDAARTLEAFSARLRDETDLDALNAHLVTVVRETMQPAHTSLWLREQASVRRSEHGLKEAENA